MTLKVYANFNWTILNHLKNCCGSTVYSIPIDRAHVASSLGFPLTLNAVKGCALSKCADIQDSSNANGCGSGGGKGTTFLCDVSDLCADHESEVTTTLYHISFRFSSKTAFLP